MPGYEITTIGLTGDGYEYVTVNGGLRRQAAGQAFNAAGMVQGVSARYNVASAGIGQDVWVYDGTTTRLIGLIGEQYQYAWPDTGGGLYRYSTAWEDNRFNEAGQVSGFTWRFNAEGKRLGQDAWLYDGDQTILISPTGTNFQHAYKGDGGGTVRYATAHELNASGQVRGDSDRRNANGHDLGDNAWFYNGTETMTIGLTGTGYQYNHDGAGGGIYLQSFSQDLNDAGQVLGYSQRYNASERSLGRDVWLYENGSTTRIGPEGAGFEYAYDGPGGGTSRFVSAGQMNLDGYVVGGARRYNADGGSLGFDNWLYDGTSTHILGLTGTEYGYAHPLGGGLLYRTTSSSMLNTAGQVVGTTRRYDDSGRDYGSDAWFFDGTTTKQIGLVGSDYEYIAYTGVTMVSRGSELVFLTDAGTAVGHTGRYNATGEKRGQDAWVYDGQSTRMVGLVGGTYDYEFPVNGGGTYRESYATLATESGMVAGNSKRSGESFASLGQDAWLFDGETTHVISLTGEDFEFDEEDGRYRYNAVAYINEAGQAVGHTNLEARTNTSFQTAWFFDPSTETTTAILPDDPAIDSLLTEANFLSEDGIVLGEYRFDDGGPALARRAFLWRLEDGFHDLGTLVEGFEETDWQTLGFAVETNDLGLIHGRGLLEDMDEGSMAFILRPVPEPGSLAILVLAGALASPRRRT